MTSPWNAVGGIIVANLALQNKLKSVVNNVASRVLYVLKAGRSFT